MNKKGLRERRIEAGMTQQELADISGVSIYTISKLERTGSIMHARMSTTKLLADALGCSYKDLAEGSARYDIIEE